MLPVVAVSCAVPMHVVYPTVCRVLRSDPQDQWALLVPKDLKVTQVFVAPEEKPVAQEKMDHPVQTAEKVPEEDVANLVHVSMEHLLKE